MPCDRPRRRSSSRPKTQAGNILFLILLAVVLFAALANAVTSSLRGGGKDGSSESAYAGAAAILQWFSAIDTAVLRMNLNGIPSENISFGYDGVRMDGSPALNTLNNNRCLDDSCRVFNISGGSVAHPDFLIKYLTESPTGWDSNRLRTGLYGRMVQWPGASTSLPDGAIYVEGVKPAVCDALRNQLNQTSFYSLAGSTSVFINNISNWDIADTVFTGSINDLYSTDTTVQAILGSGAGRSCAIYHLVIRR